jgi:hypothetical protein
MAVDLSGAVPGETQYQWPHHLFAPFPGLNSRSLFARIYFHLGLHVKIIEAFFRDSLTVDKLCYFVIKPSHYGGQPRVLGRLLNLL